MTGKALNDHADEFVRRHIGPDDAEKSRMLDTLGLVSMDALIDAAVPAVIRRARPLALAPPRTEVDVLDALQMRASRNRHCRSFIGAGFYGTHTPAVIRRNILESPGWYTAYTPYQPEISQGRLEGLLNFQTMVGDLTGMDVANASMLDEPTAAAEAMTLAHRVGKSKSQCFFVAGDVHPHTLAVVRTRARPLGIEIVTGDPETELDPARVFGVLLQYPATKGGVSDPRAVIDAVHASGAVVACATDLLACCVLVPPGELGADVVVGSAQRFGVPFGFGGPHAGFLATREEYMRSMPGRLVGVSRDAEGRNCYRLALQTREQHIRRERATSNICTAQVLLAVMAGMYAVYHGPDGLRAIAARVHRLTAILKGGLERLGWRTSPAHFFDTLTIAAADRAPAVLAAAREAGINLREIDAETVGISLDETATRGDVEQLLRIFSNGREPGLSIDELDGATSDGLPAELIRRSSYLTHPVFSAHRSETKMLRYLRSLADRDITLNRSMIPLGSCTMKLNGTTEMLPVSWPELADIHPMVPAEQAAGYVQLIGELESWLCEITGMDACSVQPNAGSQGELAGLLAIRAHHESLGQPGRDVCLIPSSAHGTNPASAQMCGMRIVVVACDDAGNIDVADLEAKAGQHADSLAALMVTYPSTHGVYEERIAEICEIVHRSGGQVYLDGANLNALVGLAAPGEFGADVMHINLHKTFCIPHGGGGPGVGPVAARRHLAPFLPSHDYGADGPGVGPVSGSAFGSAGILPISWAYIALMGADGLAEATRTAILNANYVAKRLAPHYPVLYTGQGGYVAQECIVDLRSFKGTSGVTVEDVAKRLMDYGFHAPTVSFPVPGTLMIEPTESESKDELDRFCEAMIAIRREIEAIESGAMPRDDNPLKRAPHTATMLTADDWPHPYSRKDAAYPLPWVEADKYWPPVARIDQVYGDRHPFCSCPPLLDQTSLDRTDTE